MAANKKEVEDDIEVEVLDGEEVELEEASKDVKDTGDKKKKETAGKEDERLANRGDEDEDDDERLALREQRRKEKQERKLRRTNAIQRDKREKTYLERRNDELEVSNKELEKRLRTVEGRIVTNEAVSLDERINTLDSQLRLVDNAYAKAVLAQAPDDIAQALSLQRQMQTQLDQLRNAKDSHQRQIADRQQQETQQQRQAGPDPVVASLATEWMQSNTWWQPNGGDEDSATVALIDQQLAREGYNPRTRAYWNELSRRVEDKLPHRYDDPDEEEEEEAARKATTLKHKGGPKLPTGSGQRPTSSGNKFYVSAERKAALVSAGLWDDPVTRNKYIARYRKYDQENGAT